MQNIDQVFLSMKEEIEMQAGREEKAILDEVKALEEEAYESMKAEAKKDADLKLKQEVDEMTSNAASEISESHIERTKRLISQRDKYVKTIFDEAKERLIAFSNSDDYVSFMTKKLEKSKVHFSKDNVILYVKEKDLSLKEELVKAFGKDIEVKVNKNIVIGGFILVDNDSSIEDNETLDDALLNQKEWFNKNSGLIIK